MCKKYHLRGGFAAAHPILLTQLSKSELLPLLLPTLLLLKPLLRALSTSEAHRGAAGPTFGPRGQLLVPGTNFLVPGTNFDPGLTSMAREVRWRTGGLDAGVQLWPPGPTSGPWG